MTMLSSVIAKGTLLKNLVTELNPTGILVITDGPGSPALDYVDIIETTQIQNVYNNSEAQNLLSNPVDPGLLILLSMDSPVELSRLFSTVNQHNYVFNTWIITGSGDSLFDQAMSLLKSDFHGFGPQLKMFFVNGDSKIVQFVGRGYLLPEIKVFCKIVQRSIVKIFLFQTCGYLGKDCNITNAVLEADNNLDFNGQVMTFSYGPGWFPLSFIDNDGNVVGIFPQIASEISTMLNFTLELRFLLNPSEGFAMRLDNGTWIGNLADIANGKIHSTIVSAIPTFERDEIADFTSAVTHIELALFLKRPDQNDITITNYSLEFPAISWIAISVAYFTCLIWMLLTLFICPTPKNGIKKKIISGFETIILAVMNKVNNCKIYWSESDKS